MFLDWLFCGTVYVLSLNNCLFFLNTYLSLILFLYGYLMVRYGDSAAVLGLGCGVFPKEFWMYYDSAWKMVIPNFMEYWMPTP